MVLERSIFFLGIFKIEFRMFSPFQNSQKVHRSDVLCHGKKQKTSIIGASERLRPDMASSEM